MTISKLLPAIALCMILGLIPLSGCSALIPATAATAATSVATSSGTHMAYEEGMPPSGGTVDTAAKYFDFEGVLVPPGLGLEKGRSFVFALGKINAGVLAFKGRLEAKSLAGYFMQSMKENNWDFLASASYPEIALFFSRPDRTCIIHITETMMYTWVKIWVTPSRRDIAQSRYTRQQPGR